MFYSGTPMPRTHVPEERMLPAGNISDGVYARCGLQRGIHEDPVANLHTTACKPTRVRLCTNCKQQCISIYALAAVQSEAIHSTGCSANLLHPGVRTKLHTIGTVQFEKPPCNIYTEHLHQRQSVFGNHCHLDSECPRGGCHLQPDESSTDNGEMPGRRESSAKSESIIDCSQRMHSCELLLPRPPARSGSRCNDQSIKRQVATVCVQCADPESVNLCTGIVINPPLSQPLEVGQHHFLNFGTEKKLFAERRPINRSTHFALDE